MGVSNRSSGQSGLLNRTAIVQTEAMDPNEEYRRALDAYLDGDHATVQQLVAGLLEEEGLPAGIRARAERLLRRSQERGGEDSAKGHRS